MEPRLKTEFWLTATRRAAELAGAHCCVLHRGDPDAGGVVVIIRARGELLLMTRATDAEGNAGWLRPLAGAATEEAAIDAYIEKRRRFDPDLWVVEFETDNLAPPFDVRWL